MSGLGEGFNEVKVMNSYFYKIAGKSKKSSLLLIMTFIILLINLNIYCPATLYAAGETHLDEKISQEEDWKSTEIEGYLSTDTYYIYKEFFNKADLELMGKLMTVFLAEKGKGYRIIEIEDNVYEIQSRKTIKEGSRLFIENISTHNFSFSGTMILEKLITVEADFKADINYTPGQDNIKYNGAVSYQLPGIVNGFNSFLSLFNKQDFISYKLSGFLDNLHLVFERLSALDSEKLQDIINARDKKHLVFTVEFTEEEIDLLEELVTLTRDGSYLGFLRINDEQTARGCQSLAVFIARNDVL